MRLPIGPQTGPLVMQGRKFPSSKVWTPNWLFDVVCIGHAIAEEVAERFNVELRDVHKPPSGPTGAVQLIPMVTDAGWYDRGQLSIAVRSRHERFNGDRTGSQCSSCTRWKWLPISEGEAPVQGHALVGESDVIASPESFGDGLQAFRHLLFRRRLAEYLAAAHPRAWSVVDVGVDLASTGEPTP